MLDDASDVSSSACDNATSSVPDDVIVDTSSSVCADDEAGDDSSGRYTVELAESAVSEFLLSSVECEPHADVELLQCDFSMSCECGSLEHPCAANPSNMFK